MYISNTQLAGSETHFVLLGSDGLKNLTVMIKSYWNIVHTVKPALSRMEQGNI